MRHGCLIAAVMASAAVAWATNPPADHLIPRAQSRQFDIYYEVNVEAEPLKAVELWYTFDRGATWHNYGVDDDCVAPMAFSAPEEGLCGLYFVARNDAGLSGPIPVGSTRPQEWVYVDFTPPVCQLHPPQIDERFPSNRTVELRWTALDAHFVPRPIDLSYRAVPDGSWTDFATQLPNSGSYDWRVPEDIAGEVMVRMTATDRGGNRVNCATSAIDLAAAMRMEGTAPDSLGTASPVATTVDTEPRTAQVPSEHERQRAAELLKRGRKYLAEGKLEIAAVRFRDAVKLYPQFADALVELGGTLYALDQQDEAGGAYESLLRFEPQSRAALVGLAKVQVKQHRFDDAAMLLRQIVDRQPKDAEAWLHLGDVAVYQGDAVAAKDYYFKAATMAPEQTETVEKAHERLESLPTLTSQFSQAKPGS